MDAIEQGQWTIEQSTETGAWYVLDANRRHVAKIHPREDSGDAKRIARLVAGMPELLNALKNQAAWTRDDGSACFCGNTSGNHASWCESAHASIVKAEEL